jgi:magnesium-transporting ATPase (P-type)
MPLAKSDLEGSMATDKPITRERILRILDTQAEKTARAIAGLDEATLSLPARDDGWTAKEILAHMASGHEGMLALAQDRIPSEQASGTLDLNAHNEAQRQRTRGLPLADVLVLLDQARQRVRAYIEQVDEAELNQIVCTPWMGDHPKGQFLIYPALHEGGHRAELEKWRATLAENV